MLRNEIYYRLKPLIPAPLRRTVRQYMAARIRRRTHGIWPIFPGSERAPEGWRGWWNGRQFAVVLTHDVERQGGLDKCRQLMQLEHEKGFRSSFNFVPEGSYYIPANLRQELADKGFEVGVHDLKHDGRLFQSRRAFSKKAEHINRYLKDWNASGFRSGFMLHNLDWLHDLDICYDMSTFDTDPFEPQPEGYGTIFPFWVNRPPSRNGPGAAANGAVGGYVELPYTLPQDSTLFLLLGEKTPEIWLRKLDWIASNGGMVLVNVHPDYIDFDGSKHKKSRYPATIISEFLDYLSRNYAGQFWNPTAGEVTAWYRDWYTSVSKANGADMRGLGTKESDRTPTLEGRRAAVVLYSHYPADPRPRRAAEALVSAGAEVDLVCLRNADELTRETIAGVNVLRLPLPKKRDSKLMYFSQYTSFLFACLALLAGRSVKRRYDLVHVHNMPDVLVFSALIPKLLGAKLILDLHDPMPELMMSIYNLPEDHSMVRLLRRLEKLSIGFSTLAITPNKSFQDLFISRDCSPDKMQIVMNSPEEQIFQRMPDVETTRDLSKFRVMYHGLIAERHGLDTAVRAIALVSKSMPDLEFHIFGGRTSYMDEVDGLIEELQLRRHIVYHGYQPQPEIAKAIAQMDLGVIPNRRGPFTELNMPTRIFEYLAMGKPVVVPNTRGVRDYFTDSSAFFFEPGDPASLAEAIQLVASSPRQVDAVLGEAQDIYTQHRWEIQKKAFLTIVSSCLSAG